MIALKFSLVYMLGVVASFTILFATNVYFTNWQKTELPEFIADTKDIARFAFAWPVSSLALVLALVIPEARHLATVCVEYFATIIYKDRTK
jgi:hypothetical protein